LYALDRSRTTSAQDDVGIWVLVRCAGRESGIGFWYGVRGTNRELGFGAASAEHEADFVRPTFLLGQGGQGVSEHGFEGWFFFIFSC
jgi:hypothetical protein